MMGLLWLRRLAGSQLWKTLGASLGVALAVAVLGSLGAFLTYSFSVMTDRAIAGVPIDWQVQLAPGADAAHVSHEIYALAYPSAAERVAYADVSGFSASSSSTMQTTGAGVVVGVAPGYRARFPAVFRTLTGSPDGVLLAQQTAANLHARAGDVVTVARSGSSAVRARVDGVVDLPFADSFFQLVGVPASAGPQAPPDNVLIVPLATWHRWFDAQAARRPHSVRGQLHVRVTHFLPHDPVPALDRVLTMARDVELYTAGAVVVGDNLAAQLQSTREDAFYARLLFLFLGLPGAILAGLVAIAVIASGDDRRRREAALLRIRGASFGDVRRLVTVEAAVVAVLGALGGAALTFVAVSWFVGHVAGSVVAPLGWATLLRSAPFEWAALSCVVAAVVVFVAYLSGVGSAGTAAEERKTFSTRVPLWRRIYLDWVLLAFAALAFWKIAATGYQVVVAPEGVLQATVSYDAFLAPLCLWLGGALLARRLAEVFLARRSGLLDRVLAPLTGSLSTTVAATLSRQRASIAAALMMLGLALSFAISTAVFNATYNAQARVDAELTNGADVTVTIPTATPVDKLVAQLRHVPGVEALDVMQHRFAYVGQDLQDFYGIDAGTISSATHISDAYFSNGDARASLTLLNGRADGVFVSQETVNDFQLKPGDSLNLRLQFARDGRYHSVPFTFVGVTREFPTAPKDSFIVANARYVAAATGTSGAQTILMRTSGDSGKVAALVRPLASELPGARVSDIGAAVRSVGSSLTSVDLRGLSAVELLFAVVLAAGVAFLTLALGFAERRRSYAILSALGANARQLSAFLWSEGLIMLVGGMVFGFALGFGVAVTLVKVLTGVFDPPPSALTIPWGYLALLVVTIVVATVATIVVSAAAASRDPVRELRRS